jgi:acetyltransferase-like isoleucine patch superfamily enzyme
MNIFKRIINKINFEINMLFKPTMIGRYRRADGIVLPLTRISNTTYIDSPDKLFIEDNVFIGHFNFIDASNGLHIGEGCQITNYVSIITHSSHNAIRIYGKYYHEQSNPKIYTKGEVRIGAYTFIGPHSLIQAGSSIGKGSIISAYSNVKGNFPDFSILKGNPAIVIGDTRSIDETILNENPDFRIYYSEWVNKK